MSVVKRNRSKKIYEKDFNLITIGDVIFDECDGPCSGGALYDNGEKVIKVTSSEVITLTQSYNRKTGKATSPPLAYFIQYWQKG